MKYELWRENAATGAHDLLAMCHAPNIGLAVYVLTQASTVGNVPTVLVRWLLPGMKPALQGDIIASNALGRWQLDRTNKGLVPVRLCPEADQRCSECGHPAVLSTGGMCLLCDDVAWKARLTAMDHEATIHFSMAYAYTVKDTAYLSGAIASNAPRWY